MRILIIRLGAIGDVVHSTIIADMIKKKFDGSNVFCNLAVEERKNEETENR